MVSRAPIVAGILGILLAAGGAGAAPSGSDSSSSARAYAVRVVVPGAGGGTREIGAPPRAVQFAGGFAYPADGSAVQTGAITVNASATEGSGTADASAVVQVGAVSLFGGEVTASSVAARARAEARSGNGSGDTSRSGVSGLVVNGQAVSAGSGSRVTLGDWGYAVVSVGSGSAVANGYGTSVTGLQVHITADHGGLPAGSSIVIGYAEATAAAAPAPPPPPPTAPHEDENEPPPPAATPRPSPPPGPPPVRPVPKVVPKLTGGGYVFPVYGPSSFGPSFQAPRAHVSGGWHHGVDVFAPYGAPVLAVANGTLFQVGWNNIGGNRLWLRDREGNEFYYAHLSAYSPLAVDGAQVRAGDVIAFVGTSGDAEGTPPHLHFEFHPEELLHLGYDGVVDPYEYLLAWQRLDDLPLTAGGQVLATIAAASNAPTPGAYLLSSSDISTASGLDPGSLTEALEVRVSAEGAVAPPAAAALP